MRRSCAWRRLPALLAGDGLTVVMDVSPLVVDPVTVYDAETDTNLQVLPTDLLDHFKVRSPKCRLTWIEDTCPNWAIGLS